MDELKTVESSVEVEDPLYTQQKDDVQKMRSSLLSCSGDIYSTQKAIQNITILRIYHQVSRIIRYLEMMDKLEEKMYRSLDHTLNSAADNPATVLLLLSIQEKMQKAMTESEKLLKPYLDAGLYQDSFDNAQMGANEPAESILTPEARSRVRNSAQNILKVLESNKSDVS